jgi:Cu2+-exporting ATPase
MTARRVRAGVAEDVQAVELAVGDEILVRTGEVFAADGAVVEGDGRVDESMLTGESAAIAKPPGARVHQGTHNLGSPLRVSVTAVSGNTVLSGIVALLERAQAERPRLAKAADRAAAWFLGRILVGAALVFAVWWYVDPSRAFSATLAVLVVTCPCALSLATPTALAAATAALARRGILVAHTDAIEALSKATHVMWDKTGTLTKGLVRVEEVRTYGGVTDGHALAWAAALEQMSEHPIARAFAVSGAATARASDVAVRTGLGLEGRVEGRRLRIGTRAFASELQGGPAAPGLPETSADGGSGESWVHLGDDAGLLASFRLTDPLRPEAGACVAGLAGLGLPSEVVSGDESGAVARIAARCGIERYAARLAPQDKLERLKALQATGAVVVAVGDGINDAPLLRGADVAVAMGRGSALAQTSADLIMVRESLDDLPHTVELARRTQRVIRQNLAWSIGYNLAALPLAALGFVPPWLAAIGMSLSSVVVVLNAMRLSRGSAPVRRPQWPVRPEPRAA